MSVKKRIVGKSGLRQTQAPDRSSFLRQVRNRTKPWTVLTLVLFGALILYRFVQFVHDEPLLSSQTLPDNEPVISAGRLTATDDFGQLVTEPLLACIPTVSRGNVEYVSNTVKSWRVATNQSTVMRRLVVIKMDPLHSNDKSVKRFEWLRQVFGKKTDGIPPWLILLEREGSPQRARKSTLGDSPARIAWRSKEAQDYAQTLSRCASLATGRYILIVQDDVLFTSELIRVVEWADAAFVDRKFIDSEGHTRIQRVCSLSLFDITSGDSQTMDSHQLQSSNMVARIWRVEDAERVARYIDRRFDEAPVDWLVDDMCRKRRQVTLVREPNPVRHRGLVSSYADNDRKGLLT